MGVGGWEAPATLPAHALASPPRAATPSAPRSVLSQINGSVAVLEWSEPLENGGRDDVAYHVACLECPERQPCRPCSRLGYTPRARGLVERTVTVEGLHPYVTYSFQIQAVNGVSDKSHNPPQAESINITTSKDGESSPQEGEPCSAWGPAPAPPAGRRPAPRCSRGTPGTPGRPGGLRGGLSPCAQGLLPALGPALSAFPPPPSAPAGVRDPANLRQPQRGVLGLAGRPAAHGEHLGLRSQVLREGERIPRSWRETQTLRRGRAAWRWSPRPRKVEQSWGGQLRLPLLKPARQEVGGSR